MHLVKCTNSRIVSPKHTGILKWFPESAKLRWKRERERRGLNMYYYGYVCWRDVSQRHAQSVLFNKWAFASSPTRTFPLASLVGLVQRLTPCFKLLALTFSLLTRGRELKRNGPSSNPLTVSCCESHRSPTEPIDLTMSWSSYCSCRFYLLPRGGYLLLFPPLAFMNVTSKAKSAKLKFFCPFSGFWGIFGDPLLRHSLGLFLFFTFFHSKLSFKSIHGENLKNCTSKQPHYYVFSWRREVGSRTK